ncbi:MAG: transcription elongation factor GreA [Candidatus Omnitrophica bacterium]|nr:transcription elongation factor GreA [Candidatus Omnitrophota bacterium]
MKPIYLTREGYEKLHKELGYLTKTKRREISKQLEFARGLGDLRENAEYDSAKQAQALLEKRIAELEAQLSQVTILDDTKMDKSKAYLGAAATLKDMDSGEEIVYTLVNQEEADISQNKISINSPVGKALLGHKTGDIIEINVPVGTLKYKVTKISR